MPMAKKAAADLHTKIKTLKVYIRFIAQLQHSVRHANAAVEQTFFRFPVTFLFKSCAAGQTGQKIAK